MKKSRDFLLHSINIVHEPWGIYIYENVLHEYLGKEYMYRYLNVPTISKMHMSFNFILHFEEMQCVQFLLQLFYS